MKARATLASVLVLLALIAALMGIAASPAFAAPCGNGQGQALLLGCESNTSTDPTVLTSSEDSSTVLQVFALGPDSTGVRGDGTVIGVWGTGGPYGVFGTGDTYGVYGFSTTGSGLYGLNGGSTGIGVEGETGGSGSAVYGHTTGATLGVGVFGNSSNGTGVRADSSSGTALKVDGRATFSTAGTALVHSGQKSVTVTLAGVTPSDFVLATVQGSGSFYVKNASAGSGQLTININKAAAGSVKVGFFVISAS